MDLQPEYTLALEGPFAEYTPRVYARIIVSCSVGLDVAGTKPRCPTCGAIAVVLYRRRGTAAEGTQHFERVPGWGCCDAHGPFKER